MIDNHNPPQKNMGFIFLNFTSWIFDNVYDTTGIGNFAPTCNNKSRPYTIPPLRPKKNLNVFTVTLSNLFFFF
jgi:hypothetical protein